MSDGDASSLGGEKRILGASWSSVGEWSGLYEIRLSWKNQFAYGVKIWIYLNLGLDWVINSLVINWIKK